MKYKFLRTDDWMGFYDPEGKLLYEGHSMPPEWVLEYMKMEYDDVYVEDENFWDEHGGHCPETWKDVENYERETI
jgi:hypothetical protein